MAIGYDELKEDFYLLFDESCWDVPLISCQSLRNALSGLLTEVSPNEVSGEELKQLMKAAFARAIAHGTKNSAIVVQEGRALIGLEPDDRGPGTAKIRQTNAANVRSKEKYTVGGDRRFRESRTRQYLAEALATAVIQFLEDAEATKLLRRDLLGKRTGRGTPLKSYKEEPLAQPPTWHIPPRRNYFAAREDELRWLDQTLEDHQETSPIIAVITGIGGVGKTELTIQWAHQALERGAFQDGALYLDLQGFSEGAQIDASTAAHTLLGQLDANSIPDDSQARRQLLRSLIADRNTLVILDNAKDEEHVETLLPTSGRSFVIITTRKSQLAGLTATDGLLLKSLPLHPLNKESSMRVLVKALGSVVEDASQADPMVASCGGLPLALRIMVGLIASRGGTLSGLVEELAHEPILSVLNIGDARTDLPRVFSTSYRYLSPEHQRAFRLLGLRLGRGIDSYALARLADIDVSTASDTLKSLEHVGLIERSGARYGIHDLLYEYAVQLLKADKCEDRQAVLVRLVHSYYGCVNYAFNSKNPRNPMVDLQFLEDWQTQEIGRSARRIIDREENAALWFAAERENLVDLVKRSCGLTSVPSYAPKLAFSLFYFLEAGRYWTAWEAVNQAGYEAAVRSDDNLTLADLKRNIGRVYFVRARDYSNMLRDPSVPDELAKEAARENCSRAAAAFEESDRLYTQCKQASSPHAATVKRELADVYLEQAKLDGSTISFDRAIHRYVAAKELFEQCLSKEDQKNPIASLNVSLGEAYRRRGKPADARRCLDEALAYARERKENDQYVHPRVKGYAEVQYAYLHQAERDVLSAITSYDQAIETFRSDNNRVDEARTLARKGRLLANELKTSEARHALQQSLAILDELQSDEGRVVQALLDQLADP